MKKIKSKNILALLMHPKRLPVTLTGIVLTGLAGCTPPQAMVFDVFGDPSVGRAFASPSARPSATPTERASDTPAGEPTFAPTLAPTVVSTTTLTVAPTTASGVYPSTPIVTILAGKERGYKDANGPFAKFETFTGMSADKDGNVYVLEGINEFMGIRIRKITPNGDVSTLAGSSTRGYSDGNGSAARFFDAKHMTIDSYGNIYLLSNGSQYGELGQGLSYCHAVRKITPAGQVSTIFGGEDSGKDTPSPQCYLFDFNEKGGIAIDKDMNIYVTQKVKGRLFKITPERKLWVYNDEKSKFVEMNEEGLKEIGNRPRAFDVFYQPDGVAVDPNGNLYIATPYRIYKIATDGKLTRFAGSGDVGYSNGIGTTASFNYPARITSDSKGNIYVIDNNKNDVRQIRKISPDGLVSTVSKSETYKSQINLVFGNYTTGGPNSYGDPTQLATDPQGNIYFTDQENHNILKIRL